MQRVNNLGFVAYAVASGTQSFSCLARVVTNANEELVIIEVSTFGIDTLERRKDRALDATCMRPFLERICAAWMHEVEALLRS